MPVKGLIFAEFVEFAETRLGVPLPGAAFRADRNYPSGELMPLVERVGREAGLSSGSVLVAFGRYLFARFATLYPVFFVDAGSALDLLARINTHVHDEVRKLYPDAEFPRFDVERPAAGRLALVYRSRRPLADLAEGLIRGCIAHFGDQISVERHDSPGDAGHEARFVLQADAHASPRRSRAPRRQGAGR
jgi:hypothetical protein